MQFEAGPLPNLPQFSLNKTAVRGRTQGFKLINGMNFVEPHKGSSSSNGAITSLAVGQQIASKVCSHIFFILIDAALRCIFALLNLLISCCVLRIDSLASSSLSAQGWPL
jgi:hypothetical protein